MLICGLFLNVIGYHVVFRLRQAEVKAEMKKLLRSNMNNKDVEQFVFSLKDRDAIEKLEWEGDDEFSLDGKMYDVIEKRTENGKLIIRCISDEKETILIKKYEQINNEAGNSKGKTALLIKLIGSSYLATSASDLSINDFQPIQKTSFTDGIISIDHPDVLTPPPQLG